MGDFDFNASSFKMSGFKELYRAIDHLPEVVKAAELSPLLVRSLEPMRIFASTIAPDDPLTGPPWNLNTSIEVGTRQRSGRAKADRALGRFDSRAYVGPTKYGYPQAIMREFGTIYQTAWPFMRPAWDSQKQVALNIIQSGLAESIQMIVRKYGPAA
jgi:hypothetical protein